MYLSLTHNCFDIMFYSTKKKKTYTNLHFVMLFEFGYLLVFVKQICPGKRQKEKYNIEAWIRMWMY